MAPALHRTAAPVEDCLCQEIPRVAPPFEVLLLGHASEIRRTTRTGRWVALALGAPILDYGLAGAEAPGPHDVLSLAPPGARA